MMEFKAPGKYLSPAQKKVQANIEATGFQNFRLIRSAAEFSEALGLPVRELW